MADLFWKNFLIRYFLNMLVVVVGGVETGDSGCTCPARTPYLGVSNGQGLYAGCVNRTLMGRIQRGRVDLCRALKRPKLSKELYLGGSGE